MKRTLTICVIALQHRFALAQSAQGESFFDKYLPIAQLFDSPVFFGIVVGSAGVLLAATFVFLKYAKWQEKRAENWGAGKSPQTLAEALSSPIPSEARMAYIYLRRHGDEKEIAVLTQTLEEQRRKGSVSDSLIYLLEDMQVQKALPILQQIAKGKSQVADLAGRAADYLIELQEEEESQKTAAKKS